MRYLSGNVESTIVSGTESAYVWRERLGNLMGFEAMKMENLLVKVRGSGRELQVAKAQEWPRGATPHPRSSGCTGAGGPRGSYSIFKVRKGGCEKIPLVQGKE